MVQSGYSNVTTARAVHACRGRLGPQRSAAGQGAVWLLTALLGMSGGCRDSGEIDAARGGPVMSTAAFLSVQQEMKAIPPGEYTSATVCGACHQAIHASWQQAMHARSFTNAVFQGVYRETVETYGEERSRLCLHCHAPTVQTTGDYALQNPITAEGVTCDYCHSVRSVDLSPPLKQANLDVGRTKYSPLRSEQSPVHMVVDSELHRRSEFCATCHEFQNEHGVPILETYSEWKASPYAAEGVQCQDCHMPAVTGRRVSLGLARGTRSSEINLHEISGSRDLERVRSAVTMDILGVEHLRDRRVLVRIMVSNVGSGHYFPTGLPTHEAILEVRLTDRGRLVAERTITFAKVLLNERMAPLDREEDMFLEARSIRSDTRLAPREDRTVRITFDNVEAPEGVVEAALSYQYASRMLRESGGVETIEPAEMKFLIASRKRALPLPGALR